jgi:tetratricopeptide (TPR) repeat protein
MQRQSAAGRLGLVLGLACSLVACSQFQGLKAKKHFKEANGLYQQQDYKRAALEYEEAIKNDPELTAAYFYLGNSYDNLYKPARQGEPDNDRYLQDAIRNYELAAEKESNPQMRKLALEYLVAAYGPDKLNDPEKAEPLIKKMIEIDPNDPTNYFALAKMYEDSGDYENAEQILQQAKEKRPNDAAVWMQLAGFYNRQGDFEKTIEALDERARREPTNPEAFYTIATFYWDKAYRDFRITEPQKREYSQAGLVAIDKAIELNPNYMEAITYRGLLLRVLAAVENHAPAERVRLLLGQGRCRALE